MSKVKSSIVNTFLPPYLSAAIPKGMLVMVANKGGIAAKNSAWLGVKLYHLIKNGPRAANIPHIPKPREKATNAIHNTRELPAGSVPGGVLGLSDVLISVH
jgi:hypothetical protein